MKIKVSEASGPVLDWMVAKCEGYGPDQYMKNIDIRRNVEGKASCLLVPTHREYVRWSPSTDWNLAGPIIEREKIELRRDIMDETWHAQPHDMDSIYQRKAGPTPLIAAMRCYVASKLGEEVEVPSELLT